MLQVRKAWRSSPGGLEVLRGRRSHFLPEQRAAVRAKEEEEEDDGGGGGGEEGEDALSREEFSECCPLIWSQPHTLSVSHSNSLSFFFFSPLGII